MAVMLLQHVNILNPTGLDTSNDRSGKKSLLPPPSHLDPSDNLYLVGISVITCTCICLRYLYLFLHIPYTILKLTYHTKIHIPY